VSAHRPAQSEHGAAHGAPGHPTLRAVAPTGGPRGASEAEEASSAPTEALDRIAEALEQTGWATALVDSEWRMYWISTQLRAFMGNASDEELGLGTHFCEALIATRWRVSITAETRRRWFRDHAGKVASDTPGGIERVRQLVSEDDVSLLDGVEAVEPPPLWGWTLQFFEEDTEGAASARCLAIRHERDGRHLGTTLLYGADLPATLLALLARGDSGMFERMARLAEPARRSAAILFVDICSSGALSRRLPTGRYFSLVQAVMTAIDQVLGRHRGIVGKHVGDGATGFFLSDDLGSDSTTARAAIEAGREVVRAAHEAAIRLSEEGSPVTPEEVEVRVALHWGWSLYMGQVVRGSRLEVSALGDEVTECARIEQAAPEGGVLASKTLVERLEAGDAEALGLDRDRLRYRSLGELPRADDKARRDAGGIAVADVGLDADEDPLPETEPAS
jgi:class 3 adenylate cyclase